MSGDILTRLEIDVMQGNEILESFELAHKYRMPAVVIHPSLSSDALVCRGRSKGQYKIITPVDWPNGSQFSVDKFRGLSLDSLETDGFEIYISPNKSADDIKKEIMSCTDFIKKFLGELIEIRFVLGTRTKSDENMLNVYSALSNIKNPNMIRDDVTLKTQNYRANAETHNGFIEAVKTNISCPLKVSGNIENIDIIDNCPQAKRFGVSLQQAKTLVRSYNNMVNKK